MNSSLRVVIADDERDTREFMQELLLRLGHRVALAENGRVPFLIVRGRKGGSAMAVAAVNALASEAE